jgi:hypothetical protein
LAILFKTENGLENNLKTMAKKVSLSRLFQVWMCLNAVVRCQDQRAAPLPREESDWVDVFIVFDHTNATVTTGTYFSG